MRIGCLQFAPQVGDVDNNLNRADSVLSKANPEDLDLLVLPELAFSGYNFKSLQEITPFLEHSGSGITSLWARTMALKYNCNVTVGYPEKVDVAAKWPTGPEYYNSAIVVNRDGETIANYRKSFLYYTDETWALEGEAGFFEGYIPGLGHTSIGICMDLNPYKFEAPWSDFEFAFHILEMESNLVIVSMAWMTREDQRHFSRMPNDPDMDTLTYWVTRLEPLIRSENEEEIIVVFCNRTGHEGEATYAGTSAVIGIHDGEVRVYGLLGRGEKELLVVDTTKSPYAKLVYRPEGEQESQAPSETIQISDESDAISTPRTDVINDSDSEKAANKTGAQPYTEKALPPLPDSKNVSPKKHLPPAITIPPTPDIIKTDPAKSSTTENGNIPTPSAPTPTPGAIRPRLIIPESPSVLSHQALTGHPVSPALLVSAHSVTSNVSAASMNTVYSNPRRPEDSTPYPHSAITREYVPDFKSERKIYGGKVAVATGDEPLSPASTYEEGSPTSARFFWEPRDPAIHSPIGKQPGAFPWDAIAADLPSGGGIDKGVHEKRLRNNETPTNHVKVDSQTARSEFPPAQPRHGTSSSQSSQASERIETEVVDGSVFERPASPKSRNASRSRLRDRSDSALSHRDITRATALLEEITDRAQSVQTIRAASAKNDLWPEPLAPAKSQNPDVTGSPKAKGASEEHFIPIAACPTIVRNEDRHNHHQSMARLNHAQRSNSSPRTNSKRFRSTTNETSTSQTSAAEIQRPQSRAASRGRTPGPKNPIRSGTSSSVPAPQERASSNDSTRNDVLHHSRTRSKQSRNRHGSSTSQNRHNRRRPSRGVEASDFERVEQVLCPSCPVHSHRAQSNVASNRTNAVSANNSPQLRQSPPRGSPAARPTSAFEPRHQRKHSSRRRNDSTVSGDQPVANEFQIYSGSSSGGGLTSPSADGAGASGNNSGTDTSQGTSRGRSHRGTLSHEPRTPRAMVIRTNDSDVDSIPSLSGARGAEIGTVVMSPASRSV